MIQKAGFKIIGLRIDAAHRMASGGFYAVHRNGPSIKGW